MSKIKTANEILEKHVINDEDEASLHTVLLAMKEYAEQFIDLAAEKATTRNIPGIGNIVEVNKQSILKIKKLIK